MRNPNNKSSAYGSPCLLLEKALKEEGVLNCYCTLAQINYPWIREKFEGELAKGGLTTLMPQDAYRVKKL